MEEAEESVVEPLCLRGYILRVTRAEFHDGVTVERGEDTLIIERRFSAVLAQLHETVGKLYGLSPPSKRALTTPLFSQTKGFVRSRLNELQTYFNLLLSQPGIDKNNNFIIFFELDKLGAELQQTGSTATDAMKRQTTLSLVELLGDGDNKGEKPIKASTPRGLLRSSSGQTKN